MLAFAPGKPFRQPTRFISPVQLKLALTFSSPMMLTLSVK
jgi:hypothetical protein